MPRIAKDITGKRFGRILVLARSGLVSGAATWNCRCDCGNNFIAQGGNLRKGDTRSCGCLRNETTRKRSLKHGHIIKIGGRRTASRTYRCWTNMISRCENKNVPAWRHYGGRGITVCKRWRSSFVAFLKDMGESPDGLTIERKNNSKGYSKLNCVWATYTEQNNNRRTNHRFRVVTVFRAHKTPPPD